MGIESSDTGERRKKALGFPALAVGLSFSPPRFFLSIHLISPSHSSEKALAIGRHGALARLRPTPATIQSPP